jgi:succinoglycan biosynthesis protein ExoW
MKVSVVIPYYQEQPGILVRALQSLYAQEISSETLIDVIIVNDASPIDPIVDVTAAGAPPSNIGVRIITRANGGPAAARNTGFDAVPADATYVAMLDSDDTWTPNHIARALEGFALADADIYFSDHATHHADDYLKGTRLFLEPLGGEGELTQLPGDRFYACSGKQMAAYSAREYLAHTSSILIRAELLKGLRMPEKLRWAGEDHNFFIDLTLKARRVCLSMYSEVALGKGVSIYEGSHEWGSAKDLRRRAFNIVSVRRVQHRTRWPKPVRADLSTLMSTGRRTVGYLLMQRILSKRGPDISSLRLVWSLDRTTVLFAPFSVLDVFARKLLRRAGIAVTP